MLYMFFWDWIFSAGYILVAIRTFFIFLFCIEERQTRLVEEFMSGKLSFISKED